MSPFDDRFRPVPVRSITFWDQHLFTLTLDAPTEALPGQFVRLGLEVEGKAVSRAYSLCSAPGQPMATYVVSVEGGLLSPRLAELKPGDPVWLGPAAGRLTLDRVPDAPALWLLCTGTGLSPFLAMIDEGTCFERFDTVVLVHAVRYPGHRAYLHHLEALADRGLRLVHVISRTDLPDALTGHLQDRLADGSLEAAAGRPLGDQDQVMVVGNPGMVKGTMAVLKERGATLHTPRREGRVHVERYW